MTIKTIAKAAVAAVLLLAPVSGAYAYSIHVLNGVYTIKCENGVTSTGTTLQVSHAQAAYFCKVRGSSMTTNKGDAAPKAQAAPKKQIVPNR